jgi:chaperonin GroES
VQAKVNMIAVIPLGDRIIVRLVDAVCQPETARSSAEARADETVRGVVIAAGAGCLDHQGQSAPLAIAAGDTILFGRHLGREITFGGMQCWILKADDVVKVEARAAMPLLRGETGTRRP